MSEPVKVVVIVDGGSVVSVLSGIELDIVIVDYDSDEEIDEDEVVRANLIESRLFNDGTLVSDFIAAPATVEQIY